MLFYAITYIGIHVATFLFYRYYMLKDIFDTKDN